MGTMNGIDISSYQKGLDLKKVPAHFVIIKATEGTTLVQPTCDPWVQECIRQAKPWGFYHFCAGGDPIAEADWFVKNCKNYFGHGLPVFDYEAYGRFGTANAKLFLDRVYKLTGVRCVVYTSRSIVKNEDWSKIAPNHPLWVAQYADNEPVNGYLDNPWIQSGGFGAWKSPIIHQYTSNGYLPGWGARLDLDKAFIDANTWNKLACAAPKKSLDDVVWEVFLGEYGTGKEREAMLKRDGYDPEAVQDRVNTIEYAARDVIAGKYGNGATRRAGLERNGLPADLVQKRVNQILS